MSETQEKQNVDEMKESIKEAVREYVGKMKNDPFYRLTANVQEASPEETAETLAIIDSLSDDDLAISSTERVSV